MTDINTRAWYITDELNAWAEKYHNQQWRNAAIRLGEELASVGPVGYYEMDASEWLDWAMANVKSQIEFAPVKMVAYNCKCGRTMKFESEHGVIAPQRTWVGLTDEDKQKLVAEHHDWESLYFAVQAKLKERNT